MPEYKDRPVFLIGFMGSGKTTNGKKIARHMNRAFIDLDDVFEEQTQLRIADYFTAFGEAAFRNKERELLLQHDEIPAVIATGGGAPCFFDNMEWMLSKGLTVYLKAPAHLLANRLANSKHQKRPLVNGKSVEEILALVEERMPERQPFYEQAHLHIELPEDDLEGVAQRIREALTKE